jgi:hypothetical protein
MFNETLFYDPGTSDMTKLLQVEAEEVIEVLDMATSQPPIVRGFRPSYLIGAR